jgi:hypothetical protein
MTLEDKILSFREHLGARALDHTNPSYERDRQLLNVYDLYFNIDTDINKIKPSRYVKINEQKRI